MKKSLLSAFLAFASVGLSLAQVQRMQILESFSGENCAPCAAVNPYVTSLMNANTDKIVLLKYQVPIPSAGPLYTNTVGRTDVDARMSYYSVSSAPDAYQDGNVFGDHPGNFTQTNINTQNGVASYVSINLSHSFNDTKDSIIVSLKAHALSDLAGSFRVRIAVIEEGMYYTTAPGSNGEKEFHNVVKKMLPNALGTLFSTRTLDTLVSVKQILNTIPSTIDSADRFLIGTAPTGDWEGKANQIAEWNGDEWEYTIPEKLNAVRVISNNRYYRYLFDTWTQIQNNENAYIYAGDSIVITQKWKLTQIRDMGEVGVIAFVQNDANKNILQAAQSQALPLSLNVALSSITFGEFLKCGNNISGSVLIKNTGETTIEEAIVRVKINALPEDTLYFTGSLAFNETANFPIPLSLTNQGLYTITITVDKPNGQTDPSMIKNVLSHQFFKVSEYVAAPQHQTFQTTPFPSTGWFIHNPDAGPTWTRRNATNGGGFGQSSACAKMDYFNSNSGNIDYLYMSPFNISTLENNPNLYFSIAHARYNTTTSDMLTVEASTDCGNTWTNVWEKSGAALATTNPTTSSYVATASHWRAESVSLDEFAGFNEVIIRFKATSGYGNNLYLDDVKLNDYLVSAKNVEETTISLSAYPNPAKDEVKFNFGKNTESYTVNIINLQGQVVKSETFGSNANEVTINTSNLAGGLYTYQVNNGNELKKVGKINILK
jgi:hypothetical protein